jgi:hypothetical protein
MARMLAGFHPTQRLGQGSFIAFTAKDAADGCHEIAPPLFSHLVQALLQIFPDAPGAALTCTTAAISSS